MRSARSRLGALVAAPLTRVRRRIGAMAIRGGLEGLAHAARLHPRSRVFLSQLQISRDVPYKVSGDAAHTLDVYRHVDVHGVRPAVFYVHGGGFRICSKETHWAMAGRFARAGYVVFNINYRLAPKQPFPAAIEDTCDALRFVVQHAAEYGADPTRLVLAGESAGANLAVSAALCATHRRPEPFARALFDTGIAPLAVAAACGIYQVSDPERFVRRRELPTWLYDRILETCVGYVPDALLRLGVGDDHLALADPVCFLERGGQAPERRLPAFYLPVGTRDPLIDDTRRLRDVLLRRGARVDARFYIGGIHAFHALPWDPRSEAVWRDQLTFLERVLDDVR